MPKEKFIAPKEKFIAPKEKFIAPKEKFIAPKESFIAPKESFLAHEGADIAKQRRHVVDMRFDIAHGCLPATCGALFPVTKGFRNAKSQLHGTRETTGSADEDMEPLRTGSGGNDSPSPDQPPAVLL